MDREQSQPKPWRDHPLEDDIEGVEGEPSEGGSASGEADSNEWRNGHNQAWRTARGQGFKTPRAAKRPRDLPSSPVSEEQDPELDAKLPATSTDLRIYFGRMPEDKQIAICRAYASYLSARRRGITSK